MGSCCVRPSFSPQHFVLRKHNTQGDVVWASDYGSPWANVGASPYAASMVVSEARGLVCLAVSDGGTAKLVCFETDNGRIVWDGHQYPLPNSGGGTLYVTSLGFLYFASGYVQHWSFSGDLLVDQSYESVGTAVQLDRDEIWYRTGSGSPSTTYVKAYQPSTNSVIASSSLTSMMLASVIDSTRWNGIFHNGTSLTYSITTAGSLIKNPSGSGIVFCYPNTTSPTASLSYADGATTRSVGAYRFGLSRSGISFVLSPPTLSGIAGNVKEELPNDPPVTGDECEWVEVVSCNSASPTSEYIASWDGTSAATYSEHSATPIGTAEFYGMTLTNKDLEGASYQVSDINDLVRKPVAVIMTHIVSDVDMARNRPQNSVTLYEPDGVGFGPVYNFSHRTGSMWPDIYNALFLPEAPYSPTSAAPDKIYEYAEVPPSSTVANSLEVNTNELRFKEVFQEVVTNPGRTASDFYWIVSSGASSPPWPDEPYGVNVGPAIGDYTSGSGWWCFFQGADKVGCWSIWDCEYIGFRKQDPVINEGRPSDHNRNNGKFDVLYHNAEGKVWGANAAFTSLYLTGEHARKYQYVLEDYVSNTIELATVTDSNDATKLLSLSRIWVASDTSKYLVSSAGYYTTAAPNTFNSDVAMFFVSSGPNFSGVEFSEYLAFCTAGGLVPMHRKGNLLSCYGRDSVNKDSWVIVLDSLSETVSWAVRWFPPGESISSTDYPRDMFYLPNGELLACGPRVLMKSNFTPLTSTGTGTV